MCLGYQATHTWFALARDDKQVFGDKTLIMQFIDQFDVRQPLLVCANLILAFNNINAAITQNSPGFFSSCEIQIENRLMVLLFGVCPIVFVVILVILMVPMCAPTRCVHVWRIKDYAINRAMLIRQLSAIYTVSNIRL
jgi:hypothetical protein